MEKVTANSCGCIYIYIYTYYNILIEIKTKHYQQVVLFVIQKIKRRDRKKAISPFVV